MGRMAAACLHRLRLAFAVVLFGLVFPTTDPQAASLKVLVDKSDQDMTMLMDGIVLYVWPVSTARQGKTTPVGAFTPYLLKRTHFSSLYDNAPMPFSIFYYGHYFIHGTTQTDRLGCVGSAGCIRLHPDNAEILFDLTRDTGFQNTRIIVTE
jgi:lipoprotein-anchoring transpeptidase ErfK/SrfK